MSLQVLANLPSVEKMAAAKDMQKFLNHHHKHAYRLVSCLLLWSACAFCTLLHLNFVNLCSSSVLQTVHYLVLHIVLGSVQQNPLPSLPVCRGVKRSHALSCRCAGSCPHVVATLWSSSLNSRSKACKVYFQPHYLPPPAACMQLQGILKPPPCNNFCSASDSMSCNRILVAFVDCIGGDAMPPKVFVQPCDYLTKRIDETLKRS